MRPLPLCAAAVALAGQGTLLETLTWQQAEKILTRDTIVVIPIGAQAKEHGPHLQLNNDWLMAEYFKSQILAKARVVVAPTVNYHFYPAFVDYPGSTTLRLETARDLLVDIVTSIARHGPRRFYALNTGVSTLRAIRPAAEILAKSGITFTSTDILNVAAEVEKQVRRQPGGTHADEIETSIMLHIAPKTVNMRLAVDDFHPGQGGLSRTPVDGKTWSASGVFGHATLASKQKGRLIVNAMLAGMLNEIESLRQTPLRE